MSRNRALFRERLRLDRQLADTKPGLGPMPIVLGGTPPRPQDTSRTSGRSPSSSAFSGLVTTHTAAPSFCRTRCLR